MSAWFSNIGGGNVMTGTGYNYNKYQCKPYLLSDDPWMDSCIRIIWWKFMTGKEITLKWPTGLTELTKYGIRVDNADPNDHWRPWLEANVGKQFKDWDWYLSSSNPNSINIKFRKGKEELAVQAALRWS